MRHPLELDVAGAREVARPRKELLLEPVIVYIGSSGRASRSARRLSAREWRAAPDRQRLASGVEPLGASVQTQGLRAVEVRPEVDEPELNRLLATSRALMLPSLDTTSMPVEAVLSRARERTRLGVAMEATMMTVVKASTSSTTFLSDHGGPRRAVARPAHDLQPRRRRQGV